MDKFLNAQYTFINSRVDSTTCKRLRLRMLSHDFMTILVPRRPRFILRLSYRLRCLCVDRRKRYVRGSSFVSWQKTLYTFTFVNWSAKWNPWNTHWALALVKGPTSNGRPNPEVVGSIPTEVIRILSLPCVVPWYPLLGLTSSGYFMDST